MKPHPVDPIALVAGLLFTFAGLAVVADRTWSDVDVTAVTAIGVAVVGLVLAVATVTRALRVDEHDDTEVDDAALPPD